MPEMRVGDIVVLKDGNASPTHIWRIEAFMVGACGQENLARLRSMVQRPGVDEHGTRHETTVVPEVFLRNLQLFAPVLRGVPRQPE